MKAMTRTPLRGAAAAMAAAGVLMFVLAGSARAVLPTGHAVRHGTVAVDTGDRTMTITQTSSAAKIDWNTFHIGKDHAVRIVQPSENAVIVNRVTGSEGSQIDGALSANGRVYLINPNGITFGKTAQVNVGGFMASTHAVSDEVMKDASTDFILKGGQGRLVQQGSINVIKGGVLTLASSGAMEQSGTLDAPAGAIHLAAAEQVTLAETGKIASLDGQFQALDHAGTTSAKDGEVSIAAGGARAPASVGGLIDSSPGGQITLQSQGAGLGITGDLRPGRRLQLVDTVDYIWNPGGGGALNTNQLERWLDDGADVEIRKSGKGEISSFSEISTRPTARGSLTIASEGTFTEIQAPVLLGAGDFTVVGGSSLLQRTSIRSVTGAVVVKASEAQLNQLHAPRLTITTPMAVSYVPKDKVYDGTTKAEVVDESHTGLTLSEGSNLRFVPAYAFDSAQAGDRTVTATMAVTGFNGDATTPITVVDGQRKARIEPRLVELQVAPVRKPFDGTVHAPVSIRPLNAVAGSDVAVIYRSAEFHSSEPGKRAVTVSGLALTGRDAGNYRLDQVQLATTGFIEAPPIVTPDPQVPVDPKTPPAGSGGTGGAGGTGASIDVKTPREPNRPRESTTSAPALASLAACRAVACEERRGGAAWRDCVDAQIEPAGRAASAVPSGGIRMPAEAPASRPQR